MAFCCMMNLAGGSREIQLPEFNTEFEFLIVLREEDLYTTCLKLWQVDRKKRFLKYKKYMNGKLDLYVFKSALDKCPYPIRGVMTPNALYAKLPKEGMYVSIDSWYHEYMKSQMLELLYIFRMLGASSVQLTLKKNTEAEHNVATSGVFAGIGAEFGVKHTSVEANGNLVELSAVYEEGDANFKPYDSIEKFYNDKYVWYLKEKQDWVDIIIQRVTCSVKELKFTFGVNNSIKVDNKFYASMKQLGLSMEMGMRDSDSVSVSGVAKFTKKTA